MVRSLLLLAVALDRQSIFFGFSPLRPFSSKFVEKGLVRTFFVISFLRTKSNGSGREIGSRNDPNFVAVSGGRRSAKPFHAILAISPHFQRSDGREVTGLYPSRAQIHPGHGTQTDGKQHGSKHVRKGRGRQPNRYHLPPRTANLAVPSHRNLGPRRASFSTAGACTDAGKSAP